MPDIALTGTSGLIVLLADSSNPGQFMSPVTYPIPDTDGLGNCDFTVGDFNGDGLPDIAVARCVYLSGDYPTDFTNTVAVLLNDTAHPGQFLSPQFYSGLNTEPYSIASADFDGDGTLDLVMAGEAGDGTGNVNVFRGDPAHPGQFLAPVSFSGDAYPILTVKTGDFNGDGFPDIVVADNLFTGIEGELGPGVYGDVTVYLGDATHPGAFLAPVAYSESPFQVANNMSLGDFNGDGILDLAVAGYSLQNFSPYDPMPGTDGLTVYSGDPQHPGQFLSPVLYQTADARNPELAENLLDLNGDGLTDLVSSGETVASNTAQATYGVTVQLAQQTQTATASKVNTGITSYAYATYLGDGNYGGVSSCEIPLDMKAGPPVISDASITNLTKTSATVSWTGNVESYGSVDYQLYQVVNAGTNPMPLTTPWEQDEAIDHSFMLPSLLPGTQYSYVIHSQAYFSGCDHYTAASTGTFTTANQ